MNDYKKVLAFYQGLAKLLISCNYQEESDNFNMALARDLAELHKEIRDLITIKGFSATLAKRMSDARASGDVPYNWMGAAFKDLAPHLRDPKARQVIDDFRKIIEDDRREHLFIHVKSTRLLGGDGKGPAVVTLVVNDLDRLTDLLAGRTEDARIKEAHHTGFIEDDMKYR